MKSKVVMENSRCGGSFMSASVSAAPSWLRLFACCIPVLIVAAGLITPGGVAGAQPTLSAMVEMRDGVSLATDVYHPQGSDSPWPVLLIRTTYNKNDLQDFAEGLTSAGVAVVAQDTRGRYASEGVDCVFRCDGDGDLKDGYDTIVWINDQAWADGNVGTWGASALGLVQYVMAPADPPGLTSMWVMVATPDFCDHAAFQGGVFRESLVQGWLQGQGSLFFLDEIAENPFCDDYWAPVQTSGRFADVTVPAVHVGGWYDIFAQGTIDAFVGYQEQGGVGAAGKQKLIMGPWTHSLYSRNAGELTYPANAEDIPSGNLNLFALWFLHYLGIQPDQAAVDQVPSVHYYVMGDVDDPSAPGNYWRTASSWPPEAAGVRFYLQPDFSMDEECPPAQGGTTSYTYDPADPSPTHGGANLTIPAGPRDQTGVEERSDTVVYTTPVFTEPFEMTGRVRANIWVSVDTPDADVMVRMSDVYPDGRSMLILDGAYRLATRGGAQEPSTLTPDDVVRAVVDLWSTSIILNAGHRLRVSITSSNYPRFKAGSNDGSNYGEDGNPTPVNVNIHHEEPYASYLEVPAVDRDSDTVVVCYEDPGPDPDGGVPDGAISDGQNGDDFDAGATDAVAEDDGGNGSGASSGGCSCRVMVFSPHGNGKPRGKGVLIFVLLFLGLFFRRFSVSVRSRTWKEKE